MFENDDWDIDENYLEDFNVNKDSSNSKSQECEVQNALQSKSKYTKIEFNTSGKNTDNGVFASQGIDKCKSAILDIFKNVNSCKENFKSNITNSSDIVDNKSNDHDVERTSALVTDSSRKADSCERGKNVVLNVFQLNKSRVEQNENVATKVDTVKSALKSTESTTENDNKLKRKKNVAFSESLDCANRTKKICISNSNEKPSTSFAVKDSFAAISSSVKKKGKSRMKQAVVREFPGPAGLIPDDVNDSEVIDLDSVDENKNNNNKYGGVCSQNTKNLFTTGAWQLMMDDLPADFDLYDIASVHQNALDYSRSFKKVPYLAGIIHKIDYKPNDPHIELKDLSGKIDARIHHSICKLYPNAFGTGIVILLKDVGLIYTSKKYVCIIISPKNLVSIYSEEARLVETPHLEELLDNGQNNLRESQISILDENEDHENKDGSQKSKASNSELKHPKVPTEQSVHFQAPLTDNNNPKKSLNAEKDSTESENIDNVHDFDFNDDDSWLGVQMEDFNTFKAHQFPSSTPMDMIQSNEKKQDSESGTNERNKILLKEKSVTKDNVFENDTDDEILSQLDVDTIAATYNG